MAAALTYQIPIRCAVSLGPVVQLYNEEVNDLLAPENAKLQIHESREAGVYVAGLREDIVTSAEHVLELLEEGERSRHTGETKMNKSSSRSHTVFRMVWHRIESQMLAEPFWCTNSTGFGNSRTCSSQYQALPQAFNALCLYLQP